MGCKSGEVVMPIGRNTDCRVVEPRSWRRIQRPSQPVAEQNHCETAPLPARRTEPKQEQKGITQADLSQGVFKRVVRLGTVHGAEKDSQGDQQEGSPKRMSKQVRELGAPFYAACQRIRQRDTNEERKRGLN